MYMNTRSCRDARPCGLPQPQPLLGCPQVPGRQKTFPSRLPGDGCISQGVAHPSCLQEGWPFSLYSATHLACSSQQPRGPPLLKKFLSPETSFGKELFSEYTVIVRTQSREIKRARGPGPCSWRSWWPRHTEGDYGGQGGDTGLQGRKPPQASSLGAPTSAPSLGVP